MNWIASLQCLVDWAEEVIYCVKEELELYGSTEFDFDSDPDSDPDSDFDSDFEIGIAIGIGIEMVWY